MFKDTKEGQTHWNEDDCYRCTKCGGHYQEYFSPPFICDKCIEVNIKKDDVQNNSVV